MTENELCFSNESVYQTFVFRKFNSSHDFSRHLSQTFLEYLSRLHIPFIFPVMHSSTPTPQTPQSLGKSEVDPTTLKN